MEAKHRFVYTKQVEKVMESARVTDEQKDAMQREILSGRGNVVPGTGGIRKIRCAIGERGKSGGIRVAYAHYPELGMTYLLRAVQKTKQTDFTAGQYKNLRAAKAQLDKEVH